MGIQVSTIKNGAGSFQTKKGSKGEKHRIGILSFEVAGVMSKSVLLWQSLSDQEMHRFKTEVIKSNGVVNFVSDDEAVLLSLACMEKLQDLTAVALAVSRLGKRCHEPALVGFEHIFNDILKQNIDVSFLEFSQKEMDLTVKKMQRYITTTSNLYQELEVQSELEQAIRRLREEGDPAHKDNLYALEQKVIWQRQEIKYLKEVSLWTRTYDKIVGILARCVCTMYGRIIQVFGYPIISWPQQLSIPRSGEMDHSGSLASSISGEEPKQSNDSMNPPISPVATGHSTGVVYPLSESEPYSLSRFSTSDVSTQSYNSLNNKAYQNGENYISLSLCFSPARHQRSMSANYTDDEMVSGPLEMSSAHGAFHGRDVNVSGCLQANGDVLGPLSDKYSKKFVFDPKTKLQNAPPSTLGGVALALHYANIIIVTEKMVKYPHLISQDARDDLYHMLPKNVRMGLRSRLRTWMRTCESPECDDSRAAEWREILHRILSCLAPLAHNMLRWQSEHNFEQQQMTSKSNVLLLQTLYFADQVKAEAAITEVLVGLNYLWRYEREFRANTLMDSSSRRELEEYLEWQM